MAIIIDLFYEIIDVYFVFAKNRCWSVIPYEL